MYLYLKLVVVLLVASVMTSAKAMNPENLDREHRASMLSEHPQDRQDIGTHILQIREEETQRREAEKIKRQKMDEELASLMKEDEEKREKEKKRLEEEKIRQEKEKILEKEELERRIEESFQKWKADVKQKQELEAQLTTYRSTRQAHYQARHIATHTNSEDDFIVCCVRGISNFFEKVSDCFESSPANSKGKNKKNPKIPSSLSVGSNEDNMWNQNEDPEMQAAILMSQQENFEGASSSFVEDDSDLRTALLMSQEDSDFGLQQVIQASKEDEKKRKEEEAKKWKAERELREQQDTDYEKSLKQDQEKSKQ